MSDKTPIVALISGSGTNLQAIIDATVEGRVTGHIRAVISNESKAFGLKRAQAAGIATEILDHRDFAERELFDMELRRRILTYEPELVVLAGFMRILTRAMLTSFEGRLFNIHPSLLPRFKGLHTHRRALEAGVDTHGCSVHFVTGELDGGPVIIQATVPVLAGDDPQTLAARVLEKEHIVYPLAIQWFCEGRLALVDGKVSKDGELLAAPVRLEDLAQE